MVCRSFTCSENLCCKECITLPMPRASTLAMASSMMSKERSTWLFGALAFLKPLAIMARLCAVQDWLPKNSVWLGLRLTRQPLQQESYISIAYYALHRIEQSIAYQCSRLCTQGLHRLKSWEKGWGMLRTSLQNIRRTGLASK
jgi:hypothetical protein